MELYSKNGQTEFPNYSTGGPRDSSGYAPPVFNGCRASSTRLSYLVEQKDGKDYSFAFDPTVMVREHAESSFSAHLAKV